MNSQESALPNEPASALDHEVVVVIDSDGSVAFIHDDLLTDRLATSFDLTIQRASHVEPKGLAWTVELAAPLAQTWGPSVMRAFYREFKRFELLKEFAARQLALQAEHDFLENYLIHGDSRREDE